MIAAPTTNANANAAVAKMKKAKKNKKKAAGSKIRARALKEIKTEQAASTNTVIPLAPFQRLVQEIANDNKTGMRFRREAIDALQAESEELLITMFNGSNLIAEKCGRETLHACDIQLYNTINSM